MTELKYVLFLSSIQQFILLISFYSLHIILISHLILFKCAQIYRENKILILLWTNMDIYS
jgi:hypothetical protein